MAYEDEEKQSLSGIVKTGMRASSTGPGSLAHEIVPPPEEPPQAPKEIVPSHRPELGTQASRFSNSLEGQKIMSERATLIPHVSEGFRTPKGIDKISQGIIDDTLSRSVLPLEVSKNVAPSDTQVGGIVNQPNVFTTQGGTITAEPETDATRLGDTRAREQMFATAKSTSVEGERLAGGVFRDREEMIQRQRSDAAMAELEEQRELGIVPRSGYVAYEQASERMRRERGLKSLLSSVPKSKRAGIVQQFVSSEGELEKEKIKGISEKAKSKEAGIVAAQKNQVEAAKLGIQAQDTASKIQLRRAEMGKIAEEYGLYKPMEARLKIAKDATERMKIQRETYTQALTKSYEGEKAKFLQDYPSGTVGNPEAEKKWKTIQDNYIAKIAAVEDEFPAPGRKKVLPSGKVAFFDPSVGKYVLSNEEEE